MPAQEILEIKFIARAGQGAKTAAQILAEAALAQNLHFQAFPQFGPERRGAPVSAFVRLSQEPILLHSQIEVPDITVVLEPSLLATAQTAKPTILVVNSDRETHTGDKIYPLDASKIAHFFLGKNFPNLVMVGALIAVVEKEYPQFEIKLDNAAEIVRVKLTTKWGKDMTEKNIAAMERGYEEMKQQ